MTDPPGEVAGYGWGAVQPGREPRCNPDAMRAALAWQPPPPWAGLSPVERSTLIALHAYASNGWTAWAAVSTICRYTGAGERAVRYAIARLREWGAIVPIDTKPSGIPVYRLNTRTPASHAPLHQLHLPPAPDAGTPGTWRTQNKEKQRNETRRTPPRSFGRDSAADAEAAMRKAETDLRVARAYGCASKADTELTAAQAACLEEKRREARERREAAEGR